MLNTITFKGIIGMLLGISIIPFFQEDCSSPNKKQTDELNSIMIFVSFPIYPEHGESFISKDSFYIHFYRNCTMYQIPELYVSTLTRVDTLGNIIDKKILSSNTKFHYWIYKNGDSSGLRFDTIGTEINSKFKVDSLIEEKTPFKEGISMDSYRLWEKLIDSAKHFITEKYVPEVKTETTPDSSFLYFRNDWSDINFSFANKLDIQKKAKLYKFRMLFNPIPKGKNTVDIPGREIIAEIRKPSVQNREEIIQLFENFKKAKN